jgi:hypothetical protein
MGAVILATIMCACSSSPTAKPTASTAHQASLVEMQVQQVLSAGETSLYQVPGSSVPCSPDCYSYIRPITDLYPVFGRVADQLQAINYPAPDRRDANSLVTSLRRFVIKTHGIAAMRNAVIAEPTYRTDLIRFIRQLHLPIMDTNFDPQKVPVDGGFASNSTTITSPGVPSSSP